MSEFQNVRPDISDLCMFLGHHTLKQGLTSHNIKQVLEVGVGSEDFLSDYSGLAQIVKALKDNDSFKPENVVAIDKNILSDDQLMLKPWAYRLPDLQLFKRFQMPVEEMAEQIRRGLHHPFDLVISKGVVAFGLLKLNAPYFGEQDAFYHEVHAEAVNITKAMFQCLNPDNLNSLLVLSDVYRWLVLPISPQDLNQVGLEVAFSRKEEVIEYSSEEREDGEFVYVKQFRKLGLFPEGFKGYNSLIARQKLISNFS